MPGDVFDSADAAQLRERGITLEEARRQIELFRRPRRYSKLVRPCTVDDGIVRIGENEAAELLAVHAEAAAAGRVAKFVPASGAASRMFKELLHYHKGPGRSATWEEIREEAGRGSGTARALATFMERIDRFPFVGDLERVLRSRGNDLGELAGAGRFAPLLEALLEPDGLDYEQLPKGLLKFHGYDTGSRTAFEEHLVEAADYARDGQGVSRLHLTVSAEHREGFERLFSEIESEYRNRYDCRFEIGYSVQKPSTDTLAVDLDDRPLRDERTRLRFRPGGHGALIENLNDLDGDLIFIKNIDNIQPDARKAEALRWKRLLGGYLVQLQRRAFDYLGRLRKADPPRQLVDEAMDFARRSLNVTTDPTRVPMTFQAARAFLIDRLNRPLRVCGVVPNTGEPGGGPFWVADEWGAASLQIVETAQIDPDDERQQRILRQATHFNPVDLVCAVRDLDGGVFDLRSYIDPGAVLISHKSEAGHELRALERPGLWNGAMARWNTAFVEVPLATFSPVKTVLDLLRDEHQPGQ